MHIDDRRTWLATRSLVLALAIAGGLVACSAARTTTDDTAGPATASGAATPAASGTAPPLASPRPGTTATSTATATAAPTMPPVVLVGAGDIASCGASGDEATADLLDGIAGTVFTAGDNAYDGGSAAEFADCYGP